MTSDTRSPRQAPDESVGRLREALRRIDGECIEWLEYQHGNPPRIVSAIHEIAGVALATTPEPQHGPVPQSAVDALARILDCPDVAEDAVHSLTQQIMEWHNTAPQHGPVPTAPSNCWHEGMDIQCDCEQPTARPVEPPDDRLGRYWHNPAGRVFCDAWTENGCAGHSLSREVVDDALARDAHIARLSEAIEDAVTDLTVAWQNNDHVDEGDLAARLKAALTAGAPTE